MLFALPGFAQERLRGMNVHHSISAADIEVLASWNVNLVRMQFAWHGVVDTASSAEYLALLEAGLSHFDTLLPVFQANGIKVVIDIHTPPGGFAREGKLPQFRLFAQQGPKNTLIETWRRISSRYSNNSTIYAYELLSEPATGTQKNNPDWPVFAKQLIDTVLENDTSHPFIIGPDYGHYPKLQKFGKEMERLMGTAVYRSQIIHSVHPYIPPTYVKQGLSTRKKVKYPTKRFNRRYLQRQLKKVSKAQRKLKVPIFVGEFSVVRSAPNAARYLNELLGIFEKKKWNWTYHIFREAHVWSVEHSENINELEPVAGETDRLKVLKKFFNKNQ